MHPLAIAGIVLGGVFLCWGGYEAIQTIYEWHNDRKEEREYKEYVRMHAEKGRFSGVPMFEEGDDSDPEDNEPLGHWQQKRASINSQSELRQRNISSSHAEKVLYFIKFENWLSCLHFLLIVYVAKKKLGIVVFV